MQSTPTNRLPQASDNGQQASTPAKPRKSPSKGKRKSTTASKPKTTNKSQQTKSKRLAAVMAIAAGCTTPAAALAMTTIAGHIGRTEGLAALWAIAPLAILIALLVVSAPHVAEAKQAIGWRRWQAWSFAIFLDFAIVVCEVVSVMCKPALVDVAWLPVAVIVGAVCYSAGLNCFINLRNAKVIN